MRFAVCYQAYSLSPHMVGYLISPGHVVSEHRSLRAACRRLASYISGKRRGEVERANDDGRPKGFRLYIYDRQTGKRLSLNDARRWDRRVVSANVIQGEQSKRRMSREEIDEHIERQGREIDALLRAR